MSNGKSFMGDFPLMDTVLFDDTDEPIEDMTDDPEWDSLDDAIDMGLFDDF